MQGKKIVRIHDKGGLAVCMTRNWGERDHKSDRKKGIRKVLNRKIRRMMKREANDIIENQYEHRNISHR